jgi:hypothetical protein
MTSNPTTTTNAAKALAVTIDLERVEGPTGSCGTARLSGTGVWAAADAQLRTWALTAPRDGCYDKVDFAVTFSEGGTYSGRFDLEFASICDLAAHIRDTAAWHTDPRNLVGAAHVNPPEWQAVLDECQLGD